MSDEDKLYELFDICTKCKRYIVMYRTVLGEKFCIECSSGMNVDE